MFSRGYYVSYSNGLRARNDEEQYWGSEALLKSTASSRTATRSERSARSEPATSKGRTRLAKLASKDHHLQTRSLWKPQTPPKRGTRSRGKASSEHAVSSQNKAFIGSRSSASEYRPSTRRSWKTSSSSKEKTTRTSDVTPTPTPCPSPNPSPNATPRASVRTRLDLVLDLDTEFALPKAAERIPTLRGDSLGQKPIGLWDIAEPINSLALTEATSGTDVCEARLAPIVHLSPVRSRYLTPLPSEGYRAAVTPLLRSGFQIPEECLPSPCYSVTSSTQSWSPPSVPLSNAEATSFLLNSDESNSGTLHSGSSGDTKQKDISAVDHVRWVTCCLCGQYVRILNELHLDLFSKDELECTGFWKGFNGPCPHLLGKTCCGEVFMSS